jgi:tight adherence protein B
MPVATDLGNLPLLKWGGLALIVIGLFLGVFFALRDPDAAPNRLWHRYVGFLERKLRLLFNFTPAATIAVVQLVAIAIVVALAVLIELPFWYLFVALAALAPMLALDWQKRQRVIQIEGQLDGFLVAMANALKATPSLGDAFASVQQLMQPPLQQEIELAVKEMRVGSTLDQALLFMANRVGSRQVDSALSAILIGRQIGGNLPKILDTTASTLREMHRLEGVVRTKTAEGKAQLWVLAFTPAVLLLMFDAVKDGYFDPLTDSVTGYVVIVLAALFWIASIVTARKILDVDV